MKPYGDWFMEPTHYREDGYLVCGWSGLLFTGHGVPTVTLLWSELGAKEPDKEMFERAVAGEFDEMVQDKRYRLLLEREIVQ